MKKLLALAVVAFLATPAFASVQNVKVSGAIDSTYLNRQHFGLGQKGAGGSGQAGQGLETVGLVDQSVFLTQTTLNVSADLSDNVSTTVGLINERAWGAELATSTDTNVQIYLAYATLREMLYSPLTVTIGRQYFGFGNGLIIGEDGINNQSIGTTGFNLGAIAADFTLRTTYDGVKAVLDYKPLTLSMIYFKNNAGVVTGAANANKDDSDVYGFNANYQLGDSYNTVAEAYIFARINGNHNTTVTDKGDQLYVPGLRVSTNPIKGLNTQAELAWQGGRKAVASGATSGGDNIRREAMAAQFMASYQLPVLEKYKPVASASYTYVSGDKNSAENRPVSTTKTGTSGSNITYSAWDPFNENQGSGTIYNTLFDLTNLHIISASLQANPIEDVTAKLTWSNLQADRKISTQNPLIFRQPDTVATAPPFGGATSSRKDMGNEYDLNVDYAYTEDVKFGLALGWFVPGNLFEAQNNTAASQAIAHVAVAF